MMLRAREPYYKNYKLYPHEVLEIRLIKKHVPDITHRELALKYRISKSHVGNLIHKRFWRHLHA